MPQSLINTGRLDDTAIQRNVTFEHGQTAVLGVSVVNIPHTTSLTVSVKGFIHRRLGSHCQVEPVGRCRTVKVISLGRRMIYRNIKSLDSFAKGLAIHPVNAGVQQTPFGQFIEDTKDTPSPVDILDVVFISIGCHLTQTRCLPGKIIDIVHGERHTGFVGNGQQVQHRVGGASHGDIQSHGIQESLAGSDGEGQYPFVPIFVISIGIADNPFGRFLKQGQTVGVRSHDGTVSR